MVGQKAGHFGKEGALSGQGIIRVHHSALCLSLTLQIPLAFEFRVMFEVWSAVKCLLVLTGNMEQASSALLAFYLLSFSLPQFLKELKGKEMCKGQSRLLEVLAGEYCPPLIPWWCFCYLRT